MSRIAPIHATAMALVLTFTGSASANLITNGTFDTVVPTNGTGGGWTNENNSTGIGGWSSSGGNPDAYFRLNSAGSSATDPTLSQTLAGLDVGQQYDVNGDYMLEFNGGSPLNSFEVRIDGTPILTTGPGAAPDLWAAFTTGFTATSTSHVLTLAAEANGSDHDYGFDNISVVPEPASWLALTGGATLLLRRRRSA